MNKNQSAVALIPARGGSKGIPKKNLSLIGKQSLLEIGIKKFKAIGVEKVYVSSDSQDILEVSEELGAVPLNRPCDLASDDASTEKVVEHFLNNIDYPDNQIVLLHQITSPFITADSIAEARNLLLQSEKYNSVISLCLGHHFEWIGGNDGTCEPYHHERNFRPRRQDLGEVSFETGGIYSFRKIPFLKQGHRFPEPTGYVMVSRLESLDIDTPEDLDFARHIYDNNLHPKRAFQ